MNRITLFLIAFIITSMLGGCGGKNGTGTNQADKKAKPDVITVFDVNNESEYEAPQDGEQAEEAENPGEQPEKEEHYEEYDYTSVQQFSDGLAWVTYRDIDGKPYVSCIGENGDVKFNIKDTGLYDLLPYNNGHALIRKSSNYYMVDTKGKVEGFYPYDQFMCWGNGCFVIADKDSSQDSEQEIYRIIDPKSQEICRIQHDMTEGVRYKFHYLGDGVFAFGSTYGELTFFFSGNGQVLKQQKPFDEIWNTQVTDGHFVSYIGEKNGKNVISIVTPEGETEDVEVPDTYSDYRFSVGGISEKTVLMGDKYQNRVCVYDIEKKSFQRYTGKYLDMIDWSGNKGIDHGVIAVTLKGENEERYVGLLTSELEEICEPIPGNSFLIGDQMLIVESPSAEGEYEVYSLDGTLTGTIHSDGELGQEGGLCLAGNGYIIAAQGEHSAYYRADGSVVLDKVKHYDTRFIADSRLAG